MVLGSDGYLYSANNGANHMKRIALDGSTRTMQRDGNFVANGGNVAINAVYWAALSPGGTLFSTYHFYVDKVVPGTGVVAVSGASGVQTGATTETGLVDGVNAAARFGPGYPAMGGVVDPDGVLYVTDYGNHAIRVVVP